MTRRSVLGLGVLIVVLAVVALTSVFPFRQILAQRQTVEQAQAQLDSLRTENDRLEAEAVALLTDGEVERLARENLGYVRPGEIAYVVLQPADEPIPVQAPVVEVVEPRAWYDAVWDFLTGQDLVDSNPG